jgi:hypothetical protein
VVFIHPSFQSTVQRRFRFGRIGERTASRKHIRGAKAVPHQAVMMDEIALRRKQRISCG